MEYYQICNIFYEKGDSQLSLCLCGVWHQQWYQTSDKGNLVQQSICTKTRYVDSQTVPYCHIYIDYYWPAE